MQEKPNNEPSISVVWVFNGDKHRFQAVFFTDQSLAEEWIKTNRLTGTLTAYPLNQGVHEWAVERGYFKPKREEQMTPSFIGNFSSASQPHVHYEDGE